MSLITELQALLQQAATDLETDPAIAADLLKVATDLWGLLAAKKLAASGTVGGPIEDYLDMQHLGHLVNTRLPQADGDHPALRALICAAIPVYNEFAALNGWPSIPLPAFCTTPTPPSPTN